MGIFTEITRICLLSTLSIILVSSAQNGSNRESGEVGESSGEYTTEEGTQCSTSCDGSSTGTARSRSHQSGFRSESENLSVHSLTSANSKGHRKSSASGVSGSGVLEDSANSRNPRNENAGDKSSRSVYSKSSQRETGSAKGITRSGRVLGDITNSGDPRNASSASSKGKGVMSGNEVGEETSSKLSGLTGALSIRDSPPFENVRASGSSRRGGSIKIVPLGREMSEGIGPEEAGPQFEDEISRALTELGISESKASQSAALRVSRRGIPRSLQSLHPSITIHILPELKRLIQKYKMKGNFELYQSDGVTFRKYALIRGIGSAHAVMSPNNLHLYTQRPNRLAIEGPASSRRNRSQRSLAAGEECSSPKSVSSGSNKSEGKPPAVKSIKGLTDEELAELSRQAENEAEQAENEAEQAGMGNLHPSKRAGEGSGVRSGREGSSSRLPTQSLRNDLREEPASESRGSKGPKSAHTSRSASRRGDVESSQISESGGIEEMPISEGNEIGESSAGNKSERSHLSQYEGEEVVLQPSKRSSGRNLQSRASDFHANVEESNASVGSKRSDKSERSHHRSQRLDERGDEEGSHHRSQRLDERGDEEGSHHRSQRLDERGDVESSHQSSQRIHQRGDIEGSHQSSQRIHQRAGLEPQREEQEPRSSQISRSTRSHVHFQDKENQELNALGTGGGELSKSVGNEEIPLMRSLSVRAGKNSQSARNSARPSPHHSPSVLQSDRREAIPLEPASYRRTNSAPVDGALLEGSVSSVRSRAVTPRANDSLMPRGMNVVELDDDSDFLLVALHSENGSECTGPSMMENSMSSRRVSESLRERDMNRPHVGRNSKSGKPPLGRRANRYLTPEASESVNFDPSKGSRKKAMEAEMMAALHGSHASAKKAREAAAAYHQSASRSQASARSEREAAMAADAFHQSASRRSVSGGAFETSAPEDIASGNSLPRVSSEGKGSRDMYGITGPKRVSRSEVVSGKSGSRNSQSRGAAGVSRGSRGDVYDVSGSAGVSGEQESRYSQSRGASGVSGRSRGDVYDVSGSAGVSGEQESRYSQSRGASGVSGGSRGDMYDVSGEPESRNSLSRGASGSGVSRGLGRADKYDASGSRGVSVSRSVPMSTSEGLSGMYAPKSRSRGFVAVSENSSANVSMSADIPSDSDGDAIPRQRHSAQYGEPSIGSSGSVSAQDEPFSNQRISRRSQGDYSSAAESGFVSGGQSVGDYGSDGEVTSTATNEESFATTSDASATHSGKNKALKSGSGKKR